jgi:hypothetical protein
LVGGAIFLLSNIFYYVRVGFLLKDEGGYDPGSSQAIMMLLYQN